MSSTGIDSHDAADGTSGAASARDQLFAQFSEVTDLQEILTTFSALCSEIGVDPTAHEGFYDSLKRELTSWKCQDLFKLLDERAQLSEYGSQTACKGKRVLIVGGGPVGLRAAIEAALLGASVDVVDKRTGFTRNNSLHLWPFLITDLRNLGAKKFYGKFASGSIEHICKQASLAPSMALFLYTRLRLHGFTSVSQQASLALPCSVGLHTIFGVHCTACCKMIHHNTNCSYSFAVLATLCE